MNKRKVEDDDNELPYKKKIIQEYCDGNILQGDKELACDYILFLLKEKEQGKKITSEVILETKRTFFPQMTNNDLKLAIDILHKIMIEKGLVNEN